MHLKELKDKSPTELLTQAENMGIEDASSMRVQDLIFAIMKKLAEDDTVICGDGVIEVHHLNPIHLFSDTHTVNYKEDLVALCPNCHTIIHKLEDPGDLDGLKQLIEENI